jgi:hypothetical protein
MRFLSFKSKLGPASRPKQVDAPDQFARIIGLFQWAVVAQFASLLGGAPRARGQDYVDPDVVIPDPPRKPEAVQVSGELDIHENYIDVPPGLQDGEDIVGYGAFDHCITAFAQIFGYGHPHQDFRLDNENGGRRQPRTAAVVIHNIGHNRDQRLMPRPSSATP